MLLADDYRDKITALIEEIAALQKPWADTVYGVPEPRPDAEPSQDDVEAASAIVVSLEGQQNDMREQLPELQKMATAASFYLGTAWAMEKAFDIDVDDADQYTANAQLGIDLLDARNALTDYIAEFTAAEQLLTQLLDHWRTALGVLEHDLAWQQYVAENFGAEENPRRGALPLLLVASDSASRSRPLATGHP